MKDEVKEGHADDGKLDEYRGYYGVEECLVGCDPLPPLFEDGFRFRPAVEGKEEFEEDYGGESHGPRLHSKWSACTPRSPVSEAHCENPEEGYEAGKKVQHRPNENETPYPL